MPRNFLTSSKPTGAVGEFNVGDITIYIIPKKGEAPHDAVVRIAGDWKYDPQKITAYNDADNYKGKNKSKGKLADIESVVKPEDISPSK